MERAAASRANATRTINSTWTLPPPAPQIDFEYEGAVPCGSFFDKPQYLLQPSQWLFVRLSCSNNAEQPRVIGLTIDPASYRYLPGPEPRFLRPTVSLTPQAVDSFSELRYLRLGLVAIAPGAATALATLCHLESLEIVSDDYASSDANLNATLTTPSREAQASAAFSPPDWGFLPPSLRSLTLKGPVLGGTWASFLMPSDSDAELPNLHNLTIDGAGFMAVPGGGPTAKLNFSRFPNLRSLNLWSIPLARLLESDASFFSRGFLSPLSHLKELGLAGLGWDETRAPTPPPGVFDSLSSLQSLAVSTVFSFSHQRRDGDPLALEALAAASSQSPFARLSNVTSLSVTEMFRGAPPAVLTPLSCNLLMGLSSLQRLEIQLLRGGPEDTVTASDGEGTGLSASSCDATLLDFSQTPQLQQLQLNYALPFVRGNLHDFLQSLPKEIVTSLRLAQIGPAGPLFNHTTFAGFSSLLTLELYGARFDSAPSLLLPNDTFKDVLPSLGTFAMSSNLLPPPPTSLALLPSVLELELGYIGEADTNPLIEYFLATNWPRNVEGAMLTCEARAWIRGLTCTRE